MPSWLQLSPIEFHVANFHEGQVIQAASRLYQFTLMETAGVLLLFSI